MPADGFNAAIEIAGFGISPPADHGRFDGPRSKDTASLPLSEGGEATIENDQTLGEPAAL
jgi:hypothetical protein